MFVLHRTKDKKVLVISIQVRIIINHIYFSEQYVVKAIITNDLEERVYFDEHDDSWKHS